MAQTGNQVFIAKSVGKSPAQFLEMTKICRKVLAMMKNAHEKNNYMLTSTINNLKYK